MPSPSFPEPRPAIAPTPLAECDRAVARVHAKRDAWLAVTIAQRIAYLERCLQGVREAAPAWVEDICRLKGIRSDEPLAGEEWLGGPAVTARNIRLLIESLRSSGHKPPPAIITRPDGQKVARVVPDGLRDKLMFGGISAEVWIEPGKEPSQGRIYREPKPAHGKVALVLGAGNVSSIPPMDVLYKLFAEDEVVVLKMNPVNEVVGPHLKRAFAALIDDGFMELVYGGAEVGAHLANHPQVDTLHVTGSNRTYDAIVWGADPAQQAERKARNERLNTRPFTAELGAVTPVLVVPGDWNEKELKFQAKHVAASVTQNASFNCNAGKVLVVAKGWNLRERFLDAVHAELKAAPARKAYYPGAQQRYQAFIEHYPQAQPLGASGEDVVPWTVIPNVPPEREQYALSNEAFCGVLAEVALPASSPLEFLTAAVHFANADCFGTLSCMLIVDERVQRQHPGEVDGAVAALRYGGIGVNTWPGLIYALCSPTWGAFPGHPPSDISSGSGVVHNTFLFDHPQKSVVRSPFVPPLKPAYFSDHRALHKLGKALVEMETKPTPGALGRLAFAGMRG
jgi:acyl-CoA reductase-like NAD-dependent aldehyde dehydrogenase